MDVKLNLKQEVFCDTYTSLDKDFFGNGVQSYIEAYNPDQGEKNWYKTACSAASRLLSKVKVCKRIEELLDSKGFNDENVDKQLLFLINQYSDFGSKLGAIKEFNNLKQRITKKLELGGELNVNPSSEQVAMATVLIDKYLNGGNKEDT